jgi:ATP-dependent Clp protease ATP-binding subunit ClpA
MLEKLTRFFRKEPQQQGDRFAQWTERAREVLRLAEKEAIRLQQPAIGCEHLLLGILDQEQALQ